MHTERLRRLQLTHNCAQRHRWRGSLPPGHLGNAGVLVRKHHDPPHGGPGLPRGPANRPRQPLRSRRANVARNLLLALVLSIAAITRVVPLILLIPLALVMVPRSGLANTLHSMATIVPAAALIIALAMLANAMRFDRLELSNSTGRHLWQSIYPIAPQMLHNHPAYPALRQPTPNSKSRTGGPSSRKIPGYEHHSQETFLRELTLWAIKHHPGPWLRHGADKFFTMVLSPPQSACGAPDRPATSRSAAPPLAPLVGEPWSLAWRPCWTRSILHSAPSIPPSCCCLCSSCSPHCRTGACTHRPSGAWHWPSMPWPSLSCLYISLQIEIALDRATLPYAPFLAIMAGLTAQITTHAFRAATGSQPTTERAASP